MHLKGVIVRVCVCVQTLLCVLNGWLDLSEVTTHTLLLVINDLSLLLERRLPPAAIPATSSLSEGSPR